MSSPGNAALQLTVGEDDTAQALGSGDLPVLATPRLLAWCEAATVTALSPSLTHEQTSVGTRVALQHLAPSPVGEQLTVTAAVVHVDGRLYRFEVLASHVADERTVGHGEITRVVVDRARFLARLAAPVPGLRPDSGDRAPEGQ